MVIEGTKTREWVNEGKNHLKDFDIEMQKVKRVGRERNNQVNLKNKIFLLKSIFMPIHTTFY